MTRDDADIAALADHEAVPLGYPRRMEAWLALRTEGRIDAPGFRLELSVEPLKHAHPWVNYRRQGALLHVGARQWRLTPEQLAVFQAYDAVIAAGDSVEARLRAWPPLVQSLHAASRGHVRLNGYLPKVLLQEVRQWPQHGMTRRNGKLVALAQAPDARWAMASGHRYYLRAA